MAWPLSTAGPWHAAEAAFHDRWAEEINPEDVLVEEAFESPTAFENRYVLSVLGDLYGKKVLDLGCGAGEAGAYFAKKGAEVTALDVSPGMVSLARKTAALHGANIQAVVGNAEDMPFEGRSFDAVYGNSVLHHCDAEKALKETARVLRSDGVALFIEPLAHNPFINVYRKMARPFRTEGERPLRYGQIKEFEKHFSEVSHMEFWLSAQVLFLWFFLADRVLPSQDRYWKRIIRQGERFARSAKILERIDGALLKLPFLRPMCWNTVVVCRHPRC